MRPSLALSLARVLLRIPTMPAPAPTPMPEQKSRMRAGRALRVQRHTRRALDPDEAKRQDIVRLMTNWQRTQWARAGYPKSLSKIRQFSASERRPMKEAA